MKRWWIWLTPKNVCSRHDKIIPGNEMSSPCDCKTPIDSLTSKRFLNLWNFNVLNKYLLRCFLMQILHTADKSKEMVYTNITIQFNPKVVTTVAAQVKHWLLELSHSSLTTLRYTEQHKTTLVVFMQVDRNSKRTSCIKAPWITMNVLE